MRLRNVSNAKEIVDNSNYVIHNPFIYKGKYKEVFGNNNSIHLEVGMGKGKFIIDMALKYPNINFIGLEKYESIVCRAVQKLDGQEIKNLKFIVVDALELGNIFDHEIETLYLNFSDPWPKKRHAKRRLTSEVFLPIYDSIFKGDRVIVQKTDNVGLFESSIVSLSTYGYTIEDICLDLANSDRDNVKTEYETKFVEQGIKINYLVARKK